MPLSYEEKLNTLDVINFESYRDLALNSLNAEEQKKPWAFIPLRGKNIIANEKELDLYFAAYAAWHKGKLDFIFAQASSLILSQKFNLIDWGCGQGTATLALCDFLSSKNKLTNIEEVTLIEPSHLAIERAILNTKKFLPNIKINTFASYFEELFPHQITFNNNYETLHIFSNILDIGEIDKDRLAKLILTNKNEHNLFITSPFYYGSVLNIDHFEACFSEKISNTFKKQNKANSSDYTYYSKVISLPKDSSITYIKPSSLPPDKELLKFLSTNYNQDEYELFYQPFLIGYVPNIVLMRKNGGVMIFEVDNSSIDELNVQFQDYKEEKEKYRELKAIVKETGDKSHIENFSSEREDITFFEKIKKYKQIILNMQKELSDNLESNKNLYGVIACTVYFPNCSSEEITQLIQNYEQINSSIGKVETICSNTFTLDNLNYIFKKKNISGHSKLFTEKLYESFSKLIKPNYHLKESGIEINLSSEQKKLAFSDKKMKIKGVAGSGKTRVLTMRAINAHKRTNDSVLILTYNLTLRNYILRRMGEIQEDFDWNFFNITNYHTLISASYVNVSKSKKKTKMVKTDNHGKKYKTILIDEGQDFEYEWYSEVIDNFADVDCELVIFADEKQNIYSRELESGMPKTQILGRWNELNKCFRSSEELVVFLEYMQKTLFEGKYEISTSASQGRLFENKTKYIFREQKKCNEIARFINTFIKNNNILVGELCILGSRRDIIANLGKELQSLSLPINSLCPLDVLKGDINYESESRKKKVNFNLDNQSITLSTIHSFKGLEHRYLFILIDDSDYFSDELLYTALTRAKKQIFVINIGNARFDKIFKTCPHVDILP